MEFPCWPFSAGSLPDPCAVHKRAEELIISSATLCVLKTVLCTAAEQSRHTFLLTSLLEVWVFLSLGYLQVPCSSVVCPWLQYNRKTFTAKPWRIHMSIWSVRPPRSQGLWGSIRISEGDTCCRLMNRDAEGDSGSHYLGLDNLWWWPGGVCYLNSLELLWIICW